MLHLQLRVEQLLCTYGNSTRTSYVCGALINAAIGELEMGCGEGMVVEFIHSRCIGRAVSRSHEATQIGFWKESVQL